MQNDTIVDVIYRTTDEVKDAMIEAGWTQQQIETIQSMLPTNDIQIGADEGRIKKKEEDDDLPGKGR